MTFTSLREILNYYLWWHQGFILILLEKIIWDPFLALLSTYFGSLEFPTLKWKCSLFIRRKRRNYVYFLDWKILEIKIFLVPPIKEECIWNQLPSRKWACTLPQVALCCFYSSSIPDSSMTLPSAREGDWGWTLPHAAETSFACSDFPLFSSCQQQSIEQNAPTPALDNSL